MTHLAGAVLSIVGIAVLIAIAVENGSTRKIVAFSIFGASLVSMYCASAFYHGLKVSPKAVAHLRRIDHMMIYILIAGSYTPVCLVLLRGRLGLGLLIAVWALAALGVFQTVVWMRAPQWLATALYIGMGWIAVFLVNRRVSGEAAAQRGATGIPAVAARGRNHLHAGRRRTRNQVAEGDHRRHAASVRVPRDLAFVRHGRELRSLLGDAGVRRKSRVAGLKCRAPQSSSLLFPRGVLSFAA